MRFLLWLACSAHRAATIAVLEAFDCFLRIVADPRVIFWFPGDRVALIDSGQLLGSTKILTSLSVKSGHDPDKRR